MAKETIFFVGGCAGTAGPPSGKISLPSARSRIPLVEAVSRSEFGTLTTSFGVVGEKTGVFIDNGAGISNVVPFLLAQCDVEEIYGLQTHYHLDHRNGLPTNRLLFMQGKVKTIFAPKLNGRSFADILKGDFSEESWPVSPEKVGNPLHHEEFNPGDTVPLLGGVETHLLNHPGGAVAFKFRINGKVLVIATDHELASEEIAQRYATFVSGADLLYADVQYREPEYTGAIGIDGDTAFVRKGWGHSTPEMFKKALALCEKPPRLLIAGHHEPRRSDEDLARLESEMQELFRDAETKIRFARELDVYKL